MAEEKKNDSEEKPLDEPVQISELVLMTILSLEAKAWAYLGLTSHPETKKPKKDLNEARQAIDCIDALYKIIEPKLTAEEKKELQVRLTNLRLNFVK